MIIMKGTAITWRQRHGHVIKDYRYMTLVQFANERIGIPHGAFKCGEARIIGTPGSNARGS